MNFFKSDTEDLFMWADHLPNILWDELAAVSPLQVPAIQGLNGMGRTSR